MASPPTGTSLSTATPPGTARTASSRTPRARSRLRASRSTATTRSTSSTPPGTTGRPKGIVHTHAIREAYCTGFAASYRIHPESVVLHSGSLVFNGAFLTLMPAFYLGCTYVLLRGFDAEGMIDAVERERATHVMLVPRSSSPSCSGPTSVRSAAGRSR